MIARTSSFIYKAQQIDINRISRELGVQYVLEGSLRYESERLRISAHLIEAATRQQIWAEQFDRVKADIFDVQDEIADAVVRAIEPEISRAERQKVIGKPVGNLNAWEAYQRGLWHFDKSNAEDNAVACDILRQAVRLDPAFVAAQVELAMAYLRAAAQYHSMPLEEAVRRAKQHAEAALRSDLGDADAHMAMGAALFNAGELPEAAIRFEEALGIEPFNVRARRYKAVLLIFSGRPAEGRSILLRVGPGSL